MLSRILVADDSEAIQKAVKLAFQGFSVRIFEAASYVEALNICRKSSPDLIIADASLTGTDGPGDFHKLLAVSSQAPMILLEGSFEPVDHAAFGEMGFKLILKKPFGREDLFRLLSGHFSMTIGLGTPASHQSVYHDAELSQPSLPFSGDVADSHKVKSALEMAGDVPSPPPPPPPDLPLPEKEQEADVSSAVGLATSFSNSSSPPPPPPPSPSGEGKYAGTFAGVSDPAFLDQMLATELPSTHDGSEGSVYNALSGLTSIAPEGGTEAKKQGRREKMAEAAPLWDHVFRSEESSEPARDVELREYMKSEIRRLVREAVSEYCKTFLKPLLRELVTEELHKLAGEPGEQTSDP